MDLADGMMIIIQALTNTSLFTFSVLHQLHFSMM